MSNERKELDAFHLSVFMQIFNDPKLQKTFKQSLRSRHPQTYQYIDCRHLLLDGRKFSEKCYWLMNGIEEFPKCPVCGKDMKNYINIYKGYHSTCSRKCGNASKGAEHVEFPYFIASDKLDKIFRESLNQLNLEFHNSSFRHAILRAYPYIFNYVYFRYEQLSGHSMPEKLYWFINGFHDFPKCTVCGKTLTAFRNASLGYAKYCDGCCYNDADFRKKISYGWHKHKEEDPYFLESRMQKTIQTNIENGHSPTWNNREKMKCTVENHLKDDPDWRKKCAQKGKQTKKDRYGDENYNNIAKKKQTCTERYGVDSYSKTDEFIEKTKAANQKNFGADFVMQSERGQQAFKQAMLKAHGCENPSQLPEVQSKIQLSKRLNGTYRKSKEEDSAFYALLFIFPRLVRQFKSEKYPFACDFYDPMSNTYFEYNGLWTHGGHFFNPHSEEDIKKVKLWKSKNTKFYDAAIYNWTVRDPLKLQTAKMNNLNYVVFWKLHEVITYVVDYAN